MISRAASRILTTAGLAAALTLVGAGAASAHVTIDPGQADPGSYSLITLKVPNESATAATSRVELTLPADTPFSSVVYVPVAGWTTELVTTTLPEPVQVGDNQNEVTEAVTSVIWTAEPGSELGDGQMGLFELSLGPVPEVGSILLPATQTYTDGSVVAWDEEGDDAEHPAPVLYVDDAPAADHHGGMTDDDAATSGSATDSGEVAPVTSSNDILARVLGIGGLIVGAVGIVLAVQSRRGRSTADDSATPKK